MDIITIAGYITASMVVIGAAYKYLIRPLYRGTKSIINLVSRLDKALPTIFAIAEQFRPNGGGSLRDVIDRIEVQQALSKSRTKVLLSMIDVGVFEADYTIVYVLGLIDNGVIWPGLVLKKLPVMAGSPLYIQKTEKRSTKSGQIL